MKRNKGIDYLRGIFILLIFLSHSNEFEVIGSQSIWGAAGVTGFFALSGFLCYHNYESSEQKDKLWRECVKSIKVFLKKFYPLYFAILCIYAFVRPGSYTDFIKCIFLTQSYWGSIDVAMSFNGNAWFLSSLTLCYIVGPILNKIIKKLHLANIVILMFGAYIIQLFMSIFLSKSDFNIGYYWVYISPAVRLIDFFEGMLLRRFLRESRITDGKLSHDTEGRQTYILGGGKSNYIYTIFHTAIDCELYTN